MERHKLVGTVAFVISAGCIAAACYFSYRAGCIFDGKQGLGDKAAAEPFENASLAFLLAAGLAFSAGVTFLPRQFSWFMPLSGVLCFVTLVLPLTVVLLFGISGQGTMACNPAASEP